MFGLVLGWFRSAGVEPLRFSFCNSLTVIGRLTADGVGISMLPPAILASELRSGALQVLTTRPAIADATMFAAYHASSSSSATGAVVEATKRIVLSSGFLTPLDHYSPAGRMRSRPMGERGSA